LNSAFDKAITILNVRKQKSHNIFACAASVVFID